MRNKKKEKLKTSLSFLKRKTRFSSLTARTDLDHAIRIDRETASPETVRDFSDLKR